MERALDETSAAHRIMADKDYRETIRLLLIEADNHCAPQAPYYETIPGAFPPREPLPLCNLSLKRVEEQAVSTAAMNPEQNAIPPRIAQLYRLLKAGKAMMPVPSL